MISREPFPNCRSGVIGLAIAGNPENEQDRFIELQLRSAIQAGERLAHQSELDHQHVACFA